mgnify:CR=1 FL=1
MTIIVAAQTTAYNNSATPITVGADGKLHVTYSGVPQKNSTTNGVSPIPQMDMFMRADATAPFAPVKSLKSFGNFTVDVLAGSQYHFNLSMFAATNPASVTISTNT